MRKNSLKRIFAALSLSAVAVTSVTCIGASAEEESTDTSTEETTEASEDTDDSSDSSLTLGAQSDGGWVYEDVDGSYVYIDADTIAASPAQNYITVDEVEGSAGAEVTVNVSIEGAGDWAATGIHVNYDTENLTLTSIEWSDEVYKSSVILAKTYLEYDGGVFFTTAGSSASGITTYASLTFTVTDDAVAGDYYPVSIGYVAGDLCTNIEYDSYDQKVITGFAFLNYTNGGVYIPEEETEATTEEETEATTADEEEETTTTTTAAAATTTTTTTAKGTATSSPKTGVAGVGVAAAGLVIAAGAAFVLRKKED